MHLATAQSTASTPITAASNPPATLASAAPPVDVVASALPVDDGDDGVVALPPVTAAAVGVNLEPPLFVKLLWCCTALPVILPTIGAVAPVQ